MVDESTRIRWEIRSVKNLPIPRVVEALSEVGGRVSRGKLRAAKDIAVGEHKINRREEGRERKGMDEELAKEEGSE
jgi:hypothetical protein